MLKAYACVPGENVDEISKEQVAERLNDGKSHIWIDIMNSLKDHQDFLRVVMHLHPLAIEDLSHPRMLPKVEEYDSSIFLILHDIVLAEKDNRERLKTYELFMFIGRNYIVTVRRHRIRAIEAYHTELLALSHIFAKGSEAVAHAILRRMIDSFFPLLDRIEAKLDASEEEIFNSPSTDDLQQIFILRKDIVKLRSIAVQQLDAINRLALGEFDILSEHGTYLARDLYDHIYRIAEKAAGFREVTMGLLDAYLSQNSNKMNEVIKVLHDNRHRHSAARRRRRFLRYELSLHAGIDHPYGWLYTLIAMGGISAAMFDIL
jgi:magnesium transporter